LVGFFKSISRTTDGHSYYPIHSVDVGIIGTNFGLFQPLVEDPYGTTTTSPETTATTGIPSTTNTSTNPSSNPQTSLISPIDLFFLIAIPIEFLILILILKFRWQQPISE
jgi:hypothetical protein